MHSWATFLFVRVYGSDLEMLEYFDENRYECYEILSPCSKGRRVVGFTSQPLCAQGCSSVNTEWRLGRSQSQSGCFGKGKYLLLLRIKIKLPNNCPIHSGATVVTDLSQLYYKIYKVSCKSIWIPFSKK
jgi:hypothetical protein